MRDVSSAVNRDSAVHVVFVEYEGTRANHDS